MLVIVKTFTRCPSAEFWEQRWDQNNGWRIESGTHRCTLAAAADIALSHPVCQPTALERKVSTLPLGERSYHAYLESLGDLIHTFNLRAFPSSRDGCWWREKGRGSQSESSGRRIEHPVSSPSFHTSKLPYRPESSFFFLSFLQNHCSTSARCLAGPGSAGAHFFSVCRIDSAHSENLRTGRSFTSNLVQPPTQYRNRRHLHAWKP